MNEIVNGSFLSFQATKKGDCTQMWCPRTDGNDGTNFAPWANGTPCGENKVCQYMKCVDAQNPKRKSNSTF